tara:strand:+ start:1438 stop:4143 length:2706 start_codon:yes stop_codon:yes gene_type:complete
MNILDFKLYIFDLDGVIIDSEKCHYESYKKAISDIKNNIFNEIDFTYEKYCEINHSIDKKISFKNIFKDQYDNIYKRKKKYYYSSINELNLIKGFNLFFNKLIINNKIVALVTDSSKETLNIIINKFPILQKIHYIVTRNDVKERKPSNEGYLKVLQKYSNIDYSEIIGFEDSYKGIIAITSVIYNTIYINDENYFYYDKIRYLLNNDKINNYKNIDNYIIKSYDNNKKFYISSKTKHSKNWVQLKNIFHITSSWININIPKEEMTTCIKQKICNTIFNDISSCDCLIFYTNEDEKDHYGSIIEIGIALSLNKKIYICGNNIYETEVLFNFKEIMDYTYSNIFNIKKILYNINLNETNKYIEYKKRMEILKYKCNNKQDNNININNTDVFDYLVISASGKGSRLLPLTTNIPKLLVTYNNNCILNNIINYWKKYTNKFIIIINNKYNKITKFYLDLLEINYEIINVELINNYENSYTLHKALSKKQFLNKKILITWCDIYPNIYINKNVFQDKNIIFTYKNYGRYEASNNNLIKKQYGNVIGIYYFSNFTYLNKFDSSMDLCDCYKDNFGDFNTFEIENLIDIGDMEKLITFINSNNDKYITRYFNKIIDIDDNKLLKKATCDYGKTIIEKESYFYKFHSSFVYIPKVFEYGEDYFIMKKIKNTQQVINFFNNSLQNKQFDILKKCLNIIEQLHNEQKITIKSEVLVKDINIEFKNKVIDRLKKIKPILDYFSFITHICNIEIKINHNEIIQKLSNNIITFFKKNITQYSSIHGDCHLSNILVDSNENYYLIDPRGYFGDSSIFGIDYYDISKILYSLSGFDEINNKKNHYFIIENNNITVNISNNMDNYLFLFTKYNTKILIDMVILHWLGLAEYSKNNIHKCVSAYYYGIYLYQKYYIE